MNSTFALALRWAARLRSKGQPIKYPKNQTILLQVVFAIEANEEINYLP
jgi:hypothetical protein